MFIITNRLRFRCAIVSNIWLLAPKGERAHIAIDPPDSEENITRILEELTPISLAGDSEQNARENEHSQYHDARKSRVPFATLEACFTHLVNTVTNYIQFGAAEYEGNPNLEGELTIDLRPIIKGEAKPSPLILRKLSIPGQLADYEPGIGAPVDATFDIDDTPLPEEEPAPTEATELADKITHPNIMERVSENLGFALRRAAQFLRAGEILPSETEQATLGLMRSVTNDDAEQLHRVLYGGPIPQGKRI